MSWRLNCREPWPGTWITWILSTIQICQSVDLLPYYNILQILQCVSYVNTIGDLPKPSESPLLADQRGPQIHRGQYDRFNGSRAQPNWPGASIFRVSWWRQTRVNIRWTFREDHRPETVKKSSCVDPSWSWLTLGHLSAYLYYPLLLVHTGWWSFWSSLVCCARPSCD